MPEADTEELPLIGRSPAMQEIYRVLARLTRTDLTVMITGETGTGKELVARALHDYGQAPQRPVRRRQLAAIPRELIESELFGHEKGAFTGAQARTAGRFEQAEGGTLFLDEIGDMPLEAQTRLLRVLQEGEYTTVGGRTPIKTDVRIIAATHRDLQPADPAGPVPRGPVLPAQRGAAAHPAAARAAGGHPRPGAPLPARGGQGDGLPPQDRSTTTAIERLQALPLAGQRARAREHGAPPGGAASRGHPDGRHRRGGAGGSHRRRRRRRAARRPRTCRSRSSATWLGISPATGASCRRPASTTASCSTWSGRC